jgi:hypothetical protein
MIRRHGGFKIVQGLLQELALHLAITGEAVVYPELIFKRFNPEVGSDRTHLGMQLLIYYALIETAHLFHRLIITNRGIPFFDYAKAAEIRLSPGGRIRNLCKALQVSGPKKDFAE